MGVCRDRFDAEVGPERVAGTATRIIVNADAVQAIVVLLRPRAADRELSAPAAVYSPRIAECVYRLAINRMYVGFQSGKHGPVTAIERKFSDGLRVYSRDQRRTRLVNRWRSCFDYDLLLNISYFEFVVEHHFRAHLEFHLL